MKKASTFEEYQLNESENTALPYKKIIPILKKLSEVDPNIVFGYPVGFSGGSKMGTIKDVINGLRKYKNDNSILIQVWNVESPGTDWKETKKLADGKISDIITFANNEINNPIKRIRLSLINPDIEGANKEIADKKLY